MKKQFVALGIAAALALPSLTFAEGFDINRMSVGAGINQNSVSGFSNATGFQIFGGYNFGEVFNAEGLDLRVEAGYWTSGDFKFAGFNAGSADGIWGTAVFDYKLNPDFSLLGRAGLDLGDDDGLMIGFGAGWNMTEQVQLRGEYVIRDNINSIQLNAVYNF